MTDDIPKMIRINFQINEETYNKLRIRKRKTGCSIASQVSLIVTDYVETYLTDTHQQNQDKNDENKK